MTVHLVAIQWSADKTSVHPYVRTRRGTRSAGAEDARATHGRIHVDGDVRCGNCLERRRNVAWMRMDDEPEAKEGKVHGPKVSWSFRRQATATSFPLRWNSAHPHRLALFRGRAMVPHTKERREQGTSCLRLPYPACPTSIPTSRSTEECTLHVSLRTDRTLRRLSHEWTLFEASGRASTSSCTRVNLATGQVEDRDEATHRMDSKLSKHARGKPTTIRLVASSEGHRLPLFLPPASHEQLLGENEVSSPGWHRDDVEAPVPRRHGVASSRPPRRATCPILCVSIRIVESLLHPVTFLTLPRKPALSTGLVGRNHPSMCRRGGTRSLVEDVRILDGRGREERR